MNSMVRGGTRPVIHNGLGWIGGHNASPGGVSCLFASGSESSLITGERSAADQATKKRFLLQLHDEVDRPHKAVEFGSLIRP